MKEGNVIDVPSNSGPVFPPTETGGKRKNCGIKKIESVCVCLLRWAKNTRQKVFSIGIAQPFQTRVKQCKVAKRGNFRTRCKFDAQRRNRQSANFRGNNMKQRLLGRNELHSFQLALSSQKHRNVQILAFLP